MKKELAREWLKVSKMDLDSVKCIMNHVHLTPVAAFHSQQSIEKSLKALLEFHEKKVLKKHDLLQLKDMVSEYIYIDDELILERLNELYIDSRYPGDMGLMPDGKPAPEDVKEFYEFARDIYEKVEKLIK